MVIVITELKCKSYLKLPAFIIQSLKTDGQARKTPGNISTAIKASGLKGYTLTVWENMTSMKNFRNSGHHKQAMKNMNRTASAFRSNIWESETVATWDEALKSWKK